eukprot:TRINITY_DN7503_c0_g1_i1.p1 TRINITY_DN7503_c0_g1~~TRINITY_DN7503_c0_g1_i1.p1  ORF type:complete len:454 (-),score=113.44 TRINITY_DN7503_c0_g1_i1:165-1526(-)
MCIRDRDKKCSCGRIRLRNKPGNVQDNSYCDLSYQEMDRGWYKRVHEYCNSRENSDEGVPDICKLNGYGIVLAYVIACGVGWILAGAIAALATAVDSKMIAFASVGVFVIFYLTFIGLFAAAWHSVREVNKDCLNKLCTEVKRQGKKSSYEMLAYSICAFATIFLAIILSLCGSLNMDEGNPDETAKIASKDDYMNAGEISCPSSRTINQMKNNRHNEQSKLASKERKDISTAAQEHYKKFVQLNKYISDRPKMSSYAKKKFRQANADGSGALNHSEFKSFITTLMARKQLPAPSDRAVSSMIQLYDTNNTNTLSEAEFERMLLEIFIESRELLIARYAVNKANSWKPAKVPAVKDIEKLNSLEEVLEKAENFYNALDEIGEAKGYSKNTVLSIDEITELLAAFCSRYRSPALRKSDIVEIMHDMGRDVRQFDMSDKRMAGYAVASISMNLLK